MRWFRRRRGRLMAEYISLGGNPGRAGRMSTAELAEKVFLYREYPA